VARPRKYTDELLRRAVKESTSIAGVLRYLGLNQAGGTHAHISRTIKAFGIDTSHFVRHQNGSDNQRRGPSDILIRLQYGSRRTKPPMLRRALVEIGRPYRCALCANPGEWRGRPLRLEVDHVDGDYHNNSADNLRFLCPNCHTQTDNYSGRSRGKYTPALLLD
jgi:5-methylcytosine-specific restriction endonuclease McrA